MHTWTGALRFFKCLCKNMIPKNFDILVVHISRCFVFPRKGHLKDISDLVYSLSTDFERVRIRTDQVRSAVKAELSRSKVFCELAGNSLTGVGITGTHPPVLSHISKAYVIVIGMVICLKNFLGSLLDECDPG
jgi:hypothetical protein